MDSNFEAIYRTYAVAVLRYASRLVRSRDVAEDIAAEVFLELYRNRNSVAPERMPAWLFTVARNRAFDYFRRLHRETCLTNETAPPDPGDAGAELQMWLTQEPALKPVHRLCLTLHFMHGMTRVEIARDLNLSEGQVKGHLQYALQLLRKAWDRAGAGGRRGF